MKSYTIVSDILGIILSCLICWFIFSFCTNRFETIVFASLVVIYANTVYSRSVLGSLSSVQSFITASLFQKLLPDDDEINDIVSTQTTQSHYTRLTVRLALGRYLALGAICAWKIIAVVVL